MAVVILLCLLLISCGGGSASTALSDAAPNETESELIWRAWDAMGVADYPVAVYRDTWTPSSDGRTWGGIGRASNAPCPSRHGPDLCAWGVWAYSRINVLQMTPAAVDEFNQRYQPPEPVNRCLFTLARLAGLLIYERMHQLGYPYPLSADERQRLQAIYDSGQSMPEALWADNKRRDDEAAFRAVFTARHGEWLAENELSCDDGTTIE